MVGDVKITGIANLKKEMKAAIKQMELEAVNELREAAQVITEAFFDRTPVWKGTTIRNYTWGYGALPAGGEKAAIGSGDPGQTGFMPLGAEPRRPANEGAVISEMNALFGKIKKLEKGKAFYFTNTVRPDQWDLVDNGMAPRPDRARNPGGVSHIAIQTAKSKLRNWK